MSWTLSPRITLANERISLEDARRQTVTAQAILERLARQPGVILADEVGMGKTFVALAVAVSVVESIGGRAPVVVMIPPGVRDKWPRDWGYFREKCLGPGRKIRATDHTVTRGAEFLKLLDDPGARRKHVIFLSHNALTHSLKDPFVQLAIIRTAFRWQRGLGRQRRAFSLWAWRVLRHRPFRNADLVERLLRAQPEEWRAIHKRVTGDDLGDEPVPAALLGAIDSAELGAIQALLHQVPLHRSKFLDERLRALRAALKEALDGAWKEYLSRIRLRLPLLILDEAHHLKNPGTRVASLFANEEDAELLRGPVGGVFDRMLFLTATPFQLGHHELVEVLRRFEGIRWSREMSRGAFRASLDHLSAVLDSAQAAALRLDRAWGRLHPDDVPGEPSWWRGDDSTTSAPAIASVVREVESKIRTAEDRLRPWVIRHVRSDRERRRSVRPGIGVETDEAGATRGLQIAGPAVLPFLLAARAQAVVSAEGHRLGRDVRAYFAEGLASSFEAYRETRRAQRSDDVLDDIAGDGHGGLSAEALWYLRQIDAALPENDLGIRAAHPKIQGTVHRVVRLWEAGEKSVVFCFYRHTGRALRNHVSRVIQEALVEKAAAKLGLDPGNAEQVWQELELFGARFYDPDAPVTRMAEREVRRLLVASGLGSEAGLDRAVGVVRRFLRTPVFVARDLDLSAADRRDALTGALEKTDASGRSLRDKITAFGAFVASRVPTEREELLDALDSIQTGAIRALSPSDLGENEGERSLRLLPNVRLANGEVRPDIRHRLLLAFNTPFYPEVLVASSVMAEGVDLHLECRHAIHHDLDWNPSVLEQRTGRLDRIGSKAETTQRPIVVYEPFLEATQDEKQFRVVKDRERWFNVVMGEKMELDEWATDRMAERVPLPEELTQVLTMRLDVHRPEPTL